VGRQYTGSAGKITNCQIGVVAAYVSRHGHAFIDRALYLPKAWTDDPARLAAAHVQEEVGFATKPRMARRMIERTITAGVPFNWVTADSIYGVSELEMALRRAGKGYVLGVSAAHQFNSWIDKLEVAGTAGEIAQSLDVAAWQLLSAGEGAKGPRLYDWAYLELADLDADEFNPALNGVWTRGLLIRRNIVKPHRGVAAPSYMYVSTFGPRTCPVRNSSMRKPASSMRSAIGQFMWHPPAIRVQTGSSRSCQRLIAGSGARPCSANSNLPPRLRTRRASARTVAALATLHIVQVVTTVSTLRSSMGSVCADPSTSRTSKWWPARFRSAIASSCGEGSMPTTDVTPEP